MLQLLTITVLVLLCASPSRACHCFIWSISNSPATPLGNLEPPVGGVINLYLWLYYDALGTGVATAEFGLDGTIVPTQFVPEPGFTSSGSIPDLQLTLDICPLTDATLIGTFTCNEPAEGGMVCIVPSTGGNLDTSPCPPPEGHDEIIGWVGYSSSGEPPCYGALGYSTCVVDAVEPTTWSEIKATYRRDEHP